MPGPTARAGAVGAIGAYSDRMSTEPKAGASPLVRAGVICFALGLVAVVVIFGMFAAGAHDLPLWLNVGAMLAPVGFGLALVGLFRQARRKPAVRIPAPGAVAR